MTEGTPQREAQLVAEMEYVGEDAVVIHLVGRLDLPGLLEFRRMLQSIVIDRPWMLLDLAAVPEIHPGVLRVLNAAQRRLTHQGSRLVLWRLRAQPLQLVRDSRLDRGIDIVTGPLTEWLAKQADAARGPSFPSAP
jgi:anti-anti-sigma regulatory factor